MSVPLQAVLLDIDNTLVLFNEHLFYKNYVAGLTARFPDLFEPQQLAQRLMEASRALMENQGQMTNADFFMDRFCLGLDHDREMLWSRFMDYYDTAFDGFKSLAESVPSVSQVIGTLKARGLRLVAASNAFWPKSVQNLRLGWAGLNPGDFEHVTALENARYLKPQGGFFKDVAEALGLAPEACLMVGNDPLNDMAAQSTGMRTYLTLDSQDVDTELRLSRSLHSESGQPLPAPDGQGPLAALPDFIDQLNGKR